MYKNKNK